MREKNSSEGWIDQYDRESEGSSDSRVEVAAEGNGMESEISEFNQNIEKSETSENSEYGNDGEDGGSWGVTRTWTRTREMRMVLTCIAVVMTRVVVVGCLDGFDRPLEKNKQPDVGAF